MFITPRDLDIPASIVVPLNRLGMLSYRKQCGGMSNTRKLQKEECEKKDPILRDQITLLLPYIPQHSSATENLTSLLQPG